MNKISDLKVGDNVVLINGKTDTFIGRHRGCSAARFKNDHHVHNDKIDWQKTNELNNKQMKELIIESPTGMEWYRENDTIKFRNIENKLPMSYSEVKERFDYKNYQISFPNDKMAAQFTALKELIILRDKWNGDWKADYNNGSQPKYCITIKKGLTERVSFSLYFKSGVLRDQFAEQFKDLIETAKELL